MKNYSFPYVGLSSLVTSTTTDNVVYDVFNVEKYRTLVKIIFTLNLEIHERDIADTFWTNIQDSHVKWINLDDLSNGPYLTSKGDNKSIHPYWGK